jgi:hypothetical protein
LIFLSCELTSSSFPLPNLDQPHQNLPSYAYPFFTAFALRYVQAKYAKNELVEFERYFLSLYSLTSEVVGFNSHPVHFFL